MVYFVFIIVENGNADASKLFLSNPNQNEIKVQLKFMF